MDKKRRICVFAGTTEGRELVERLRNEEVFVTACVATDYGEALLPEGENVTVLAGRLSSQEMGELFLRSGFHLVIDATHPYAKAVTEEIFSACKETGTEYLRLLREEGEAKKDGIWVEDARAAAKFLEGTEGTVLLTTGSKELGAFSGLSRFSERVYARVLPVKESIRACEKAGLFASHILAMQGPFSEEMNAAMLKFTGASWLVTKDGGKAGGFEEKAQAAKKAGVSLLVIGRPPQREGVSLKEAEELLCSRFGCSLKPEVSIVGIGPGNMEAMTGEARQAVREAGCLVGAGRMLKAVSPLAASSVSLFRTGHFREQAILEEISPEKIADFILSHREYGKFAVLMSGDVGFYSGARKLLPLLSGCQVKLIPGISSLSYFCSRLQTSYEDVYTASVHGRDYDFAAAVRAHKRVFLLTGGQWGAGEVCRALTEAGLSDVRVSVGERLSYPGERITCKTAGELAKVNFEPLSVMLIENDRTDHIVTSGLPDSLFLRGEGEEGIVPMTKSEVRSVCLSRLQLTETSVCWDVGAGTGSVAVEMALLAKGGFVFAVERRPEAVALLNRNKEYFRAGNLTVTQGLAPDALKNLPAPTHVFIGGSSGNLREIIETVLEKNGSARIVATAVSLETVGELTALMKEFSFTEKEVVSIQAARGREAGPYHLMTGQNPVYIFTMQKKGETP